MQQQDTLQLYGTGFQNKVIVGLLRNKQFLQQIQDVLDPNFFSSGGLKWIVTVIMEHFAKYKVPPTMDVFRIKYNEVDQEVLKTVIIDALKDIYKLEEVEDLEYIQDETIRFCRNQKLKAAILESVDLLQQGEYDKIKITIDAALKAGSDKAIGHEYTVDVEARFTENQRNCIPTPWDVINEITGGGLGAGEMAVFVAPAGIGKSMALVNVAADAARRGLNVIYYTLELSEAYVGARFDSHFTGIPSGDLKFHQDEVRKAVGQLKGTLTIKGYPTKTATVNTLSAHIDKCIMRGIKPDLVLVDYADLLRDVGGRSRDVRNDIMLGNIYEDLRGLAGLYNIPLYTASQANRSALEQDIIEADKIAEAYSKVMVADVVISLSRKVSDKISGTGRWHVIKNRFGPDGLTFPSKMNMSAASISIFAETSVQGKEVKGMMQNNAEVTRQALANKFAELGGMI